MTYCVLLNEMTPQSACEEIDNSVRNIQHAFMQGDISKEDAIAELTFLLQDLELRMGMIDHTLEEAKLFIATKLFLRMVIQHITQQSY